jgi:hypothetical protein
VDTPTAKAKEREKTIAKITFGSEKDENTSAFFLNKT